MGHTHKSSSATCQHINLGVVKLFDDLTGKYALTGKLIRRFLDGKILLLFLYFANITEHIPDKDVDET